jgi:FAD dependent oxidoreductase TIGR03364
LVNSHPIPTPTTIAESDVLIVGAGIVGLAHAAEALRLGRTVTIIDRDSRAVGASIRNFGHCCITAQSGDLLELAQVARERWLHYSALAGFFSTQSGALAVARSGEELAVLDELSVQRESGQVSLIDADAVRSALGADVAATAVPATAVPAAGSRIVGGALLRDDLRVNPREAVAKLAEWLVNQPGVRILWRTSYLGHDGDLAHSSRGEIRAAQTIICVGHDLDYLYPELAAQHEIERCALQMAVIAAPGGRRIAPAILTGTSLLRYPAFTETAASAALRSRIQLDAPELVDIGANVMFTQRPDGTILAGDSHRYSATMDPFLAEKTTDVLLAQIADVLGVERLRVLERWQGVYASSSQHPYLVAKTAPGVTAVSVTSGVGMTISFGLARRVLADLG